MSSPRDPPPRSRAARGAAPGAQARRRSIQADLEMSSPRDLRRRIRSIGGTAQITRAMQMVAASKMRRAGGGAIERAPCARRLYRMQRAATARIKSFRHPLLARREVHKRAVILIAGDK